MILKADILDRIVALDGELATQGLYAALPDVIARRVLVPAIKLAGARMASQIDAEQICYRVVGSSVEAYVKLEVVSKIKVRMFGDRRMVDLRVRHSERWDEKRIERLVSQLWSGGRLVEHALFVGFDIADEPFGGGVARLKESTSVGTEGRGFLAEELA